MTSPARLLSHSLHIAISDLRVGMFVAELDRPWTQTPFMLQGFLLIELLDLQALQALVKALVIDPSRSDPTSLSHISRELLYEASPLEELRSNATALSGPVNATLPVAELSVFSRIQVWYRRWLALNGPTILQKQDSQSVRSARSVRAKRSGAEIRAKLQPQAYYLRYESAEPGTGTDTGTNTSAVDGAEARASAAVRESSHMPAPSTPEFSEVIQGLYPRDVVFAALDWKERWQNWRHLRAQGKPSVRGTNMHQRPARAQVRNYLPKNMQLVQYSDKISVQQEIAYARNVIEITDTLLKKLSEEINDDRSITLEDVQPAVLLLTESIISNPDALMWLLRLRSQNTTVYAHGLKVSVYMMTLGRHLGFGRQQLTELGFIGILLDIGKLELPETLWQNPGKYTSQEQLLMETHISAGIAVLESGQLLTANIVAGIREHHERLDGSGYPRGLTGSNISMYGRIAAIADSFAAMTSERTYAATRSSFDAMKELFKMAESQLHAPLVEEFVQAIGIFPVGSMIELSSGEIAIVLEHNKIRRLEPRILMLTAADKSLLQKPEVMDLMRQKTASGREHIKILRGLPDGAYGLVCRDFYRA